MALVKCDTEITIDPCTGQPPPPTCCATISVCGSLYPNVEDAWKKTGLQPHQLRYMANSPHFTHIFWV